MFFFLFASCDSGRMRPPPPAIIMTVLPVSSLALSLHCTLVVCVFYSAKTILLMCGLFSKMQQQHCCRWSARIHWKYCSVSRGEVVEIVKTCEKTELKKRKMNRKTFRLTFGDRHCEITALAFQLSQIIFRTEMTNCKRELQFPPLIIYFSYIITQSLKKEKRTKCIVNFFCPSSVRRNFRNISCVMAGYRSLNGTIRWYSKKGVIFHLCSGKVNGLFISQIEHIGCFSPFIYLFILLFKSIVIPSG